MNINFALMQYLLNNSRLTVIRNVYYKGYECDVLAINKNLYITEYEIKTNKADFKKDFDKRMKYYDKNVGITVKHDEIKNGRRVNRFYFVIPEELDIDVPDYAGEIVFSKKNGYTFFKIIKRAPLLSKNKMVDDIILKQLIEKLTWRNYELERKILIMGDKDGRL